MDTITVPFETTAYGHNLTGTAEMFGWTPDERTARILASLDPKQARRAALRCMRAAARAYDAAHDARCAAK